MGTISDFAGKISGAGSTILWWAVIILVIMIVLGIGIGVLYFLFYRKKNWNLKLEIKMPTSNGKMLNAEWGKGCYDVKRGVVWVKRNKRKAVPMKPFEINKYLQGTNLLTVVRIGAEQYIPVLPKSYLHLVDDKTNEEVALITNTVDYSQSRAWRNQFERETKAAYSIMGLLSQYAPYIGQAIVLLSVFIGFVVLYTKIV